MAHGQQSGRSFVELSPLRIERAHAAVITHQLVNKLSGMAIARSWLAPSRLQAIVFITGPIRSYRAPVPCVRR